MNYDPANEAPHSEKKRHQSSQRRVQPLPHTTGQLVWLDHFSHNLNSNAPTAATALSSAGANSTMGGSTQLGCSSSHSEVIGALCRPGGSKRQQGLSEDSERQMGKSIKTICGINN
ncbi:unnamed protein product [Dibothriocephalus latus]|uniref:Uncharacterized protein n=1 Tax=Dibothriocephalus latus TaxID=60516 RepID=A0A3P6U4G7_DIBLA|nr:unnamed protein product [Dibothriocephalus latus]